MRMIDWDHPRRVQWTTESGCVFVRVEGESTWAGDASAVLTSPVHAWRQAEGVEIDAVAVMLEQVRGLRSPMDASNACWLTFEDGSNGAMVLDEAGCSLAIMAFGATDKRLRSTMCTLHAHEEPTYAPTYAPESLSQPNAAPEGRGRQAMHH